MQKKYLKKNKYWKKRYKKENKIFKLEKFNENLKWYKNKNFK